MSSMIGQMLSFMEIASFVRVFVIFGNLATNNRITFKRIGHLERRLVETSLPFLLWRNQHHSKKLMISCRREVESIKRIVEEQY